MDEIVINLRAGSQIRCQNDDLQVEYAKEKVLAEFQAFVASLTVETTNFDIYHVPMIDRGNLFSSTPSYEEWKAAANERYRKSMNTLDGSK